MVGSRTSIHVVAGGLTVDGVVAPARFLSSGFRLGARVVVGVVAPRCYAEGCASVGKTPVNDWFGRNYFRSMDFRSPFLPK